MAVKYDMEMMVRAIKRLMTQHSYFSGPINGTWNDTIAKAWQVYCKSVSYAKVTQFPNIDEQPVYFREVLLKRYHSEFELKAHEEDLAKLVLYPITPIVEIVVEPPVLEVPSPVQEPEFTQPDPEPTPRIPVVSEPVKPEQPARQENRNQFRNKSRYVR